MRKKLAIIGLLLLVLIIPTTFAKTGIGIVVGEPTGFSLKAGNFPILGVGWSFLSKKDMRIDLTLDMWMINEELTDFLDWYLGVGGKAGIILNKNSADPLRLGVRIPIGMQWWFKTEFELFGEIAPGITIFPTTEFDIGAGIGLRFYFK